MKEREIGGYLALDVRNGAHFHLTKHRYNTARNALVALCQALQGEQPLRLLLPRFNCPEVEHVLRQRTSIEITTYSIDENFEPILPDESSAVSTLYYVNLFGLKTDFAARLPKGSLIDHVHAFFSPAIQGMHTVYSARKFFGVTDGAYLYSEARVPCPTPYIAWEESAYLLQRLDIGAQAGYAGFRRAEQALSRSEVSAMSALASTLLGSLDYEKFAQLRRMNFEYLHKRLACANELTRLIERSMSDERFVPLCYPYLRADGARMRERLIADHLFVPCYWAHIASDLETTPFEKHLASNCLHLPIDQRYGLIEMDEIINRLK